MTVQLGALSSVRKDISVCLKWKKKNVHPTNNKALKQDKKQNKQNKLRFSLNKETLMINTEQHVIHTLPQLMYNLCHWTTD